MFLSVFILFSCNKEDEMPTPAQIVASFEISNASPGIDESVSFSNKSKNAENYEWDFGDGNTSTGENPSHAYSNTGSFIVRLTAFGTSDKNSTSKTIHIMAAPPSADFTVDKTSAGIGETITFSNQSENAITYEWDFGDGNTSTEENPSHEYGEVGNYTVKLTAHQSELNDSKERSIEILIPLNIFPGESAAGIALGEIWGSIKNMEGYDFTEFGPLLIGNNIFHPVEEKLKGILFFLLGSNIIKQDTDSVILISLKKMYIGTTEKGIGMGSSLSEVKNAYGEEEEYKPDTNTYKYTSLGIDFSIGETSSEVESISIYLP